MLCNICLRSVDAIGIVANCTTCNVDGTAAGIKNLDPATPLASVLEEQPGLRNRFVAEAQPAAAPDAAPKKKIAKKAPIKKKAAAAKKPKPAPIATLKRKIAPPKKKKAKK